MQTPSPTNDQFTIEARFQQISQYPFDPNRTLEEAFGPVEYWTLAMGRYQLLLLPITGQWWYLDPLHQTWENTGYKAGEITFYLQGDLLEGRAPENRPR